MEVILDEALSKITLSANEKLKFVSYSAKNTEQDGELLSNAATRAKHVTQILKCLFLFRGSVSGFLPGFPNSPPPSSPPPPLPLPASHGYKNEMNFPNSELIWKKGMKSKLVQFPSEIEFNGYNRFTDIIMHLYVQLATQPPLMFAFFPCSHFILDLVFQTMFA